MKRRLTLLFLSWRDRHGIDWDAAVAVGDVGLLRPFRGVERSL